MLCSPHTVVVVVCSLTNITLLIWSIVETSSHSRLRRGGRRHQRSLTALACRRACGLARRQFQLTGVLEHIPIHRVLFGTPWKVFFMSAIAEEEAPAILHQAAMEVAQRLCGAF